MAIRILIALAIFSAAGVYAREMGSNRATASAFPDLAGLPAALDGWESQDLTLSEQVAQVLDADVTLQRVYRNVAGEEVHVFVAYFAEQAVNSQIHSPRHCVPGSGWSITSMEATSLPLPGKADPQPARRMLIQHRENAHEMLYWFETRSGCVTGEYALKWDLVRNSLARRPTDAVFVRYTAPLEQPEATRRLIAALDAPLHDILRKVGLP